MGCAQAVDSQSRNRTRQPSTLDLPKLDRTEETCPSTPSSPVRIRSGQFTQRIHDSIFSHYIIFKEVGHGTFAQVFLAQHRRTGQRRAVKKFTKVKCDLRIINEQLDNEVKILSSLDHPNIVKIYELFEDEQNFYIVTEALDGGELFDYIAHAKHLSEPVAAHIMYQVLSAVNYLHQRQIVHRDLKPENLLLSNVTHNPAQMTIKLIDFGSSCFCPLGKSLKQKLGSPYYVAPEVLEMDYTEKCDIWSCGVILYIILGGHPPFSGRSDLDILEKVRRGTFTFSHKNWKTVSEDAKHLISSMLTKDFRTRISAAECLSHPWMQSYHARGALDGVEVLNSLDNLKTFHMEQILKRSITTFIVSQLVSSEETKQLSLAFSVLDKDGDGRLSREELVEGYAQVMPVSQAEEQVESVMKSLDFDQSGFIDFTEFLTGSLSPEVLFSTVNLECAFRAFDRDNNGKISLEELKTSLSLVEVPDDGVWRELISEVDQNGDGEIDVKEFTSLMQRAVRQSEAQPSL